MEAPDRLIAVSVDVSKIDKTKLHRGQKGTYLDVILMPRDDQYGNHYMAVQSLPKEDRDRGERGAILGNGKFLGESRPKQDNTLPPIDSDEDNLPF